MVKNPVFLRGGIFISLLAIVFFLATDNNSDKPNILIILADDLGYADIGPYGGEIPTPNLDQLAAQGLTFTQFYATPACSPTRAALLSGLDPHLVGFGNLSERILPYQKGHAGYEGYLNEKVLSLATRLQNEGYHTYMTGKWHLGSGEGQGPDSHGFDRSFALLNSGASHFSDMRGPSDRHQRASYVENGQAIEKLPEGFYSSDYYTSKLIDYIKQDKNDSAPFFAYLSFTAVHWPLQAPDEDIKAFNGKYDAGYKPIRDARMSRQNWHRSSPGKTDAAWHELENDQQTREMRTMEIYGAMISRMDMNIGRLRDALRQNKTLDNTVIIFLSDNGAAGGRLRAAHFSRWIAKHDNSLENMGRPGSFVQYSKNWSHVSNAPFRLRKIFPAEGGIRVPAIISWPKEFQSHKVSHAILSVLDIMPTVLELANIKSEDNTLNGRSLMPLLFGQKENIRSHKEVLAWELGGRAALRQGDWKILRMKQPEGSGQWQLFNLKDDPVEQYDVKENFHEIYQDLLKEWEIYAKEKDIIEPPAWLSQ